MEVTKTCNQEANNTASQHICSREVCPHFNRGIPLCVLVSGCWIREVPLYTEVSSIQGVGIEEFHCIQRCPHFRVLE